MRNRKQRRDYSGKFGEQLPAERKYWLLMLSKKQRQFFFFFFSGYWRESGRLAVRLEENFLGSADRATVEGSFVRRLGRGFRGACSSFIQVLQTASLLAARGVRGLPLDRLFPR
jgi:hypothetical protein